MSKTLILIIGIFITFLSTALGSLCVYFIKGKLHPTVGFYNRLTKGKKEIATCDKCRLYEQKYNIKIRNINTDHIEVHSHFSLNKMKEFTLKEFIGR